MLTINSHAPDFTAVTNQGMMKFHNWMGDNWCALFSHPKDFTPVCTTELGELARRMPEFGRRGCKVLGLSADSAERHAAWSADIEQVTGHAPTFPIVADADLKVAKLYGMLPADTAATSERTAMDNATVRSVFIIDPGKVIRLAVAYPMSTGRSFDEILRALDSLQLTARAKVATPSGWRQGENVIILPSLGEDEARTLFPNGWDAPKPYMRVVPQPA